MLNLWEEWFGPQLGSYNRTDCFVWCVPSEGGERTKVVFDEENNNARIYLISRDGKVKASSRIFESTHYDNENIDYRVWSDRLAYLIPKKQ